MSSATPTSSASLVPKEDNTVLRGWIELLGRLLLATLFLLSGVGKIGNYGATAGFMASVGLPSVLLPFAILAEVGGAIAIIAGWKVRVVSVLLAGFTLLTGIIFHGNVSDQIPMIMLLKNLSIAGAFLMLTANGAGRYSLDARTTA